MSRTMLTGIWSANVPVLSRIDSNYKIYYPANSANAAVYPAVQLAYHFLENEGMTLTLSTESAGNAANAIIIAEDSTMSTGNYAVTVEGTQLKVTAGDMFGFIGAAEYLTETLFVDDLSYGKGFAYYGTYTGDMRETREGTNRVMFHNIWGQDPGVSGIGLNRTDENYIKLAKASIEYELALVAAYQPDVIGFNEYLEGYRKLTSTVEPTKTELVYRMEQMGYELLEYTGTIEHGQVGNILFYNPDKVTFTPNSLTYIHYGKMYDAEASAPEGTPGKYSADPYPVGHLFEGKWYDTRVKSGKGAIVANFTDNTTQKSFTVCCTHFESNGQLDPNVYAQVGPNGNVYRREQGEILLAGLKDYRQSVSNAPIILGGDFNSQDTYEVPYSQTSNGITLTITDATDPRLESVCDVLKDGGFVNAYEQAGKAAQATSCHGYPIWNSTLERFVNYNSSLTVSESAYKGSIDHIYVYDTNDVIEECDYWNVIDKPVLSASDHKAILLDFNID